MNRKVFADANIVLTFVSALAKAGSFLTDGNSKKKIKKCSNCIFKIKNLLAPLQPANERM